METAVGHIVPQAASIGFVYPYNRGSKGEVLLEAEMSTKPKSEKVVFQDDDHPRILVTPSRLTVGNINYALSGVSDIRYDIKSKVVSGASCGTLFKWPSVGIFGVLFLISLVLHPLFLVVIYYSWIVIRNGREENAYDVVKVTFTRDNKKVVCYEDALGKHPDDRRKGLQQIEETEKGYKQRCERYKIKKMKAERIVDAIAEAIES